MANAQSVKFLRSPIAHIPSRCYVHRDQYSKISIQWLEWMAAEKGLYIQHALNEGGGRGSFEFTPARGCLDT